MRLSLSKAGRPAVLFTAATLVALTAACGPGDLNVLGIGAPASAATTAGAPAATGPAAAVPALTRVAPVQETPAPAPVPPVETRAATTVEEPVEAAPEPRVAAAHKPRAEAAARPRAEAPAKPRAEPPAKPRAEAPAKPRVDAAPAAADEVADAPEQVDAAAAVPQQQDGRSQSSTQAPVASAPAVAAAASGGSGGSYSDQARTTFTAANGQSGRYLRYAAGVDPSRPVGLVVYVDGTGEYGVDNPASDYALGGSAGLVAVAKARNMVTLAVESPNQGCECWHTGDTAAYADFLAQLIEKQFSAYPIDEVWLAGFSSGAQEITRFLVPRHPELMRVGGGWVVFGGGGPPAASGSAVTPARMAGVRGHWFTGTADTAVPLTASWGARAGESWYAARGVRVSSEYPSGVGHGLFGKLGSTVGRMIDAG